MSWPSILILAAGAYGLKLLGVMVLGSGPTASRLRPLTTLVPAALFAGLIVALTLESPDGLPVARLAGVAVAAVAAWRKLPFVMVVAAAMVTTALIRAL